MKRVKPFIINNPGAGPTLVLVVEGRLCHSRALTASGLEWLAMNSCMPWALCMSSLALTGTNMSPWCGQTFGGVTLKGRKGGGHWRKEIFISISFSQKDAKWFILHTNSKHPKECSPLFYIVQQIDWGILRNSRQMFMTYRMTTAPSCTSGCE